MEYVVLEFSELQDAFHFADPDEVIKSNGYVSIAYSIKYEIASEFIDYIRAKIQRPILLIEVKSEFKEWAKNL